MDTFIWSVPWLLATQWAGDLKSMMTSSNGNIFRVTGPLCGEFTGPVEFPTQRPVTRSFDVFFDLRLNKRLSKQPWGWWFETPSWSLWRQCNARYWLLSNHCQNNTGRLYFAFKVHASAFFLCTDSYNPADHSRINANKTWSFSAPQSHHHAKKTVVTNINTQKKVFWTSEKVYWIK